MRWTTEWSELDYGLEGRVEVERWRKGAERGGEGSFQFCVKSFVFLFHKVQRSKVVFQLSRGEEETRFGEGKTVCMVS